MRRSHANRVSALCIIGGLMSGLGCTHNHYYTATPGAALGPCDPAISGTVVSSTSPAMGTPALGAVCDDPPQGRMVVAQGGARTSPIVSNAARPINSQQPIISQPSGKANRRSSGLVWRSSGNESLASTRIEGAIEEPTTIR